MKTTSKEGLNVVVSVFEIIKGKNKNMWLGIVSGLINLLEKAGELCIGQTPPQTFR